MFQVDDFRVYEPMITVFMLIFIMIISVIIYLKARRWVLMLTVYLLSLILGIQALNVSLPLAPYFQIFFIMFETILFVMTSFDAGKKKYKGSELL